MIIFVIVNFFVIILDTVCDDFGDFYINVVDFVIVYGIIGLDVMNFVLGV